MNQARSDARAETSNIGGDVNWIVSKLEEWEQKTPGWVYKLHPNEDGRLSRFFWMSPKQIALFRLYGYVIQFDVSYNRTRYGFYLTTVILVDGENRSRNVAYCLSERQDQEAFLWVFRHLQKVMRDDPNTVGLEAVFSDRAGAISVAVGEIWPMTFHGKCIFHLRENLKKNLIGRLKWRLPAFEEQFWKVYGMPSPASFINTRNELLRDWTEVSDYLEQHIFSDYEGWAWCFVGTRFTAGIRTTGRVECEHKNQKLIGLGPNCTLRQVFEALTSRTEDQADDAYWDELKVIQYEYQ